MAIHGTVYHSPDRRWRISADPAGRKLTVDHDGQFIGEFTSLNELEAFLDAFGITFADLIKD